jgi:hexosaminidase
LEHLAVGAPVTLAVQPSPSYPGDGAGTLTDGFHGSRDHSDFRWLGFSGEDLDATVDLGEERVVSRVYLNCLQAQGPWIFLPRSVEVFVSRDGETWRLAGKVDVPLEMVEGTGTRQLGVDMTSSSGGAASPRGVPIRFVRIHARNRGPLPQWHPGAPEPAWLFADEIVVV